MGLLRPYVNLLLPDDHTGASDGPQSDVQSVHHRIESIATDQLDYSYDTDSRFGELKHGYDWRIDVKVISDGFDRLEYHDPGVSLTLDWDGIGADAPGTIDQIDCLGRLYEVLRPRYAYGMIDSDLEALSDGFFPAPATSDTLADDEIGHPTWLMLFSPPLVERYGERFLLNLPAERIDQYDDGAILVVGTDQPDGDTHPDEFFELYRPPIERFEKAFGVEHAY